LTLIDDLMQAGLIQFGSFGGVPFKFYLELLPSYPKLLDKVTDQLMKQHDLADYERLLAAYYATPIGLLISQKSGVPLVYSRGTTQSAVDDLVGAYDTGHPTLLIDLVWAGDGETNDLVVKSGRVGLKIENVLTLFTVTNYEQTALKVTALFDLHEVVDDLVEQKRLPPGQAAVVKRWIEANTAIRRRDSAGT